MRSRRRREESVKNPYMDIDSAAKEADHEIADHNGQPDGMALFSSNVNAAIDMFKRAHNYMYYVFFLY